MTKTIETLDQQKELDEGQRRMIDAANELLKLPAVAVRLCEFDNGHQQIKEG